MDTLARFEEKINEFKEQQKNKHFLDSERAEEEKVERNDSQKRKQQKVKEASKADERRSSERDIKVNKDVESKKFEQQQTIDVNLNEIMEIAHKPDELSQAQRSCIEAYCHLYGHGIEPNLDDAIGWFKKSASQGEPRALFTLGEMYELGVGHRIDLDEATEYYRKAAELNNPNAQLKLAKLFLTQ